MAVFIRGLDQPMAWGLIFAFAFFLYLIAYLSMLMKNGATAVAVLFCMMLFFLLSVFIGSNSNSTEALGVAWVLTAFVGICYLHITIGEQMEKLVRLYVIRKGVEP